jgi:hypothetical protein
MQVGVGFNVVQFGSFDQRAEDRPEHTASVAARKQVILRPSPARCTSYRQSASTAIVGWPADAPATGRESSLRWRRGRQSGAALPTPVVRRRPRQSRRTCDMCAPNRRQGRLRLSRSASRSRRSHLQAPILRALKLSNDELQSLDFAVPLHDDYRHVAHETVQKICVRRKIVEINQHARLYSSMLIRPSKFTIFDAGFCDLSARKSRLPGALRRAPINALDQHELRRCKGHGAIGPAASAATRKTPARAAY